MTDKNINDSKSCSKTNSKISAFSQMWRFLRKKKKNF